MSSEQTTSDEAAIPAAFAGAARPSAEVGRRDEATSGSNGVGSAAADPTPSGSRTAVPPTNSATAETESDSASPTETSVATSLGALVDAARQLGSGALRLDSIADEALLDALRALESARCRLASADADLVAEIGRRGLAGRYVAGTTARLISGVLRLSPAEARRRVLRSEAVAERVTLTGQPLDPRLPSTARALRRGEVSVEHVDLIDRTLRRLPAQLPVPVRDEAERVLSEAATQLEPAALANVARRLCDTLDPDGTLTDESDRYRRRHLSLRQLPDGMYRLQGFLDAPAGALTEAVLHSLAAPDADADSQPPEAAPELATRDERSSGQRLHDAWVAACKRLMAAGDLPASGGLPATVLISMTAEQFERGTGIVETGFGGVLTVAEALRLADEARIAWTVHGSSGRVLCHGDTKRIATAHQTRALISRDRGCTFPGCGQPPQWTERHHVKPWRDGGLTDVDNMCLLCDYHHDRVDREGWTIAMRDGVPWFTPPEWLDPHRCARRNIRGREAAPP